MTKEEAIEVYNGLLNQKIKEAFEFFAPELRESEDERIIEGFYTLIRGIRRDGGLTLNKVPLDKCETWLKKQKENPKSADSIPSDCVSDAKCEDRWHKVGDFLPDSGRDVLAKDALGNYLLASFDGAQWFVSVYDGEDHPVLHTPPILEWCDIPSEKQKEQKPVEFPLKDKVSSVMKKLNSLNFMLKLGSNEERLVNEITSEVRDLADYSTDKPAEWNEEDEEIAHTILNLLCSQVTYVTGQGTTSGKQYPTYPKERDWFEKRFKSLRPQPKQKWSEEDERIIDTITSVLGQYIDYKAVSGTGSGYATPRYSKEIAWLKSLRPQSKVELSEDVKKTLDEVSHILVGLNYTQIAKDYKQAVEKLLYSHPSWKPSEEQMRCLDMVLCDEAMDDNVHRVLVQLREQLKKL